MEEVIKAKGPDAAREKGRYMLVKYAYQWNGL